MQIFNKINNADIFSALAKERFHFGGVCRFFIFARELLQTLAHKRKLYNELITMLKISKFVLRSNQEKNSSVGYRFLKNDFRNY